MRGEKPRESLSLEVEEEKKGMLRANAQTLAEDIGM